MIKKVEILGIQIDNYTVSEAMLQVEVYLSNSEMNTIESVSMEMLVKAGEDETVKQVIESLDLAIVSDKEILKAAGVMSAQRIRETAEKQFFTEFLKRIIRNGKTVYLIGETRQKLTKLKDFLEENYEKLNVLGSFSMEECVGDFDGVVNEINIASPDIIFSLIPTPEQEYFLKENKSKINAEIWYGLGEDYAKAKGVSGVKKLAKKLIHKGKLHSMVSKYNSEK